MKFLPITIFLMTLLTSCSNGKLEKELSNTKSELEKLKIELKTCSTELSDIQNTPEQRILVANRLFNSGELTAAKKSYNNIISKFPETEFSKQASMKIKEIDKELERKRIKEKQKKAEEERKKALGFKILKPTNNVTFGYLKLRFEKVWIGKRWTFDGYGSRYFLRDATRGNKHVLVRTSISSETKNPHLPPIMAYQYKDGKLEIIGTLGYEFRRWKDYGSYLGNYADYGNDFAHSKTIPFNLGIETNENKLKSGQVYIVMKKSNCFKRKHEDFGQPEISYNRMGCDVKRSLELSDFDNDYILIKRL